MCGVVFLLPVAVPDGFFDGGGNADEGEAAQLGDPAAAEEPGEHAVVFFFVVGGWDERAKGGGWA